MFELFIQKRGYSTTLDRESENLKNHLYINKPPLPMGEGWGEGISKLCKNGIFFVYEKCYIPHLSPLP